MSLPNDIGQKLACSVSEAADLLGVSEGLVRSLIRKGELKTIRLGDRRLVPTHELTRITSTRTEVDAA